MLAPETGEYEFIVRTEHAARLWLNDSKRPLIDAWVKSGNDTEYRGSIFLLGGRLYPLRLEFSKAKQGVDDSKNKKKKKPEIKASIALEWKLPHRTPEVIPQRCLSPLSVPVSFVAQHAVSAGRSQRRLRARHVDLAGLGPGDDRCGHRDRRLRRRPSRRVDRRPRRCRRSSGEAARVLPALRRAGLPPAADRRAETTLRRSPVRGGPRPRSGRQASRAARPEVAAVPLSRDRRRPGRLRRGLAALAFGLWDSLPDRDLLQAAASGQLATREQVLRQAERMVADLRTHAKLREFFLQWLKVDQVPDLAKDPAQYPGFDAPSPPTCAPRWSCSSTTCCGATPPTSASCCSPIHLYLNGRLAQLYGADSARGRPVSEGHAEVRRAGRRPDASVLDGDVRLHGDQLADPSRRLPGPERAGPLAAAAARGLRAAAADLHPQSDHARARRPANQPAGVPDPATA